MQPMQPARRRGLDRRWSGVGSVALGAVAVLLVGLVGLGVVRAQAQDDAEFEGVTIEAFGGGAPSAAAESRLVLRQITFEPGAELPPHRHPGAVTLTVARGELAYTLRSGRASVQGPQVDGEAGPARSLAIGVAATLAAGDSVFLQGTTQRVVNPGEEPAVAWAASLLAADEPFIVDEASAEEPEPTEPPATPAATPESEPEPEEPEATEEPEEPEVEGIRVTLDEFSISLSTGFPAGETTFVVTNAGSVTHSFAVVGEGVAVALERPLAPGQTAELTVDLPAGTYQIVCPVANHDALGMIEEFSVEEEA